MTKKIAERPPAHKPSITTANEIIESFQIFADASPLLMWTMDAAGEANFFNSAWLAYTGRIIDEELGSGWLDGMHPEDRASCKAKIDEALKRRKEFCIEYRLRRRDGEYRWMLDQGAPIQAPERGFLGYFSSCVDIHDRKSADRARSDLQRQLVQSQKMESLGQLCTRIAHDLNNSLGVVRGHLQILGRLRESPEKFKSSIDMALTGCDQGTEMIQSLLRFGSPAASRVATVSARDFMEKTIKFLSSIVDKRVEVTLAPGQETEKVEIDENQLLQVFTNLVINAQQAMPKGGAITISIQPRDIVWGPGTSYSGVKPGRYMEIAIQDTGTGIARENLQRVFEPFFTTKEPGVGTGLGLSVAYSIVQNHRGWIEVTSPPGSGARFIVVLPAV